MNVTMLPLSDLDHILNHTRDVWEDMRGAHLFITGGTGFFGKWLLESLMWANYKLDLDCRITVLTRSPESFNSDAPHLSNHQIVTVLKGDVRTFEFPSGKFTHIIHAATESSTDLNIENPLLMFETIVEGTRHTLDFAKYCGAKKLLLTSSGAVYGKQPHELTHIPEDYQGAPNPLEPKSAYGIGKRAAEHLCALHASRYLELKIARCFAFVGPYLPLNNHYAISSIISDALRGGPIVIRGDGTPRRSYMYAADLAIWLWTILFRGGSCRPYNVGSEESLSIAETAHVVARSVNPTPKIEVRGIPRTGVPVEQYVPSTKRAQIELGLKQILTINESIINTMDFHRGLEWNQLLNP